MRHQFFSLRAGAVGCALALLLSSIAVAQTEKRLHSFGKGADGQLPMSGLLAVKGTLYGTTYSGGAYNGGTVFAINPTTGAETVSYSFCSQQGCADGLNPEANLIDVKGTLYGTTPVGGGSGDDGTVFSVNPNTGAETVVYTFCSQQNCADGATPVAGLIDVNGTLYGTTSGGGAGDGGACMEGGCGTVFAIDRATGAEKVIYSFCSQHNCRDGANPFAGLVDVKGTLYGTTYWGGAKGSGTVFSLDPKTGAETVIYSFCKKGGPYCTDGAYPVAGLNEMKGTLYGTTEDGGKTGNGTLFSVDTSTGTETLLYSFGGGGELPKASMIGVNGTLYGTTYSGGTGRVTAGTVFAFDPTTGTETVLHSFGNGYDGDGPEAGVIDVKGMLYGTTFSGGNRGYGMVFAIKHP